MFILDVKWACAGNERYYVTMFGLKKCVFNVPSLKPVKLEKSHKKKKEKRHRLTYV